MSARNCIAGDKLEEELRVGWKLSRVKLSQMLSTTAAPGIRGHSIMALMLCAAVGFAASPAHATSVSRRHKISHIRRAAVSAPLYKAALLEDADSGRVLMSSNADMEWPPASMAKMMLLLVAQEQINSGRVGGNDPVR